MNGSFFDAHRAPSQAIQDVFVFVLRISQLVKRTVSERQDLFVAYRHWRRRVPPPSRKWKSIPAGRGGPTFAGVEGKRQKAIGVLHVAACCI